MPMNEIEMLRQSWQQIQSSCLAACWNIHHNCQAFEE